MAAKTRTGPPDSEKLPLPLDRCPSHVMVISTQIERRLVRNSQSSLFQTKIRALWSIGGWEKSDH